MNHRAQAFTLAELLVVVTIIGVLVAMIFPSVSSAYSLAQEKTCNANLSVISKAVLAYYLANNDRLPKNDDADWPKPKATDEEGLANLLPGSNSTRRWWCNKVYPLGIRNRNLYRCASDPLHFNESSQVMCSYGFNSTLTDPNNLGGDNITTVLQIIDPGRTFVVGHCSSDSMGKSTVEPSIAETIALDPAKWPIGHVPDYDKEAKERLGRGGFIMASGDIKTYTYGQVKTLKNKSGQLKYFHGKE